MNETLAHVIAWAFSYGFVFLTVIVEGIAIIVYVRWLNRGGR